MQQHTKSALKTCIPEITPQANAETHLTTQTLGPPWYATLRVVRGLGVCTTHEGLGSILAVCSPGLSRWAFGPYLPHWLSRVFPF